MPPLAPAPIVAAVDVRVTSRVLHAAVHASLGASLEPSPADLPTIVVSDRHDEDVDVLIVTSTAAACQAALDDWPLRSSGPSLVSDDGLDALPSVLHSLRLGLAVVDRRVLETALRIPRLTGEQRRLLAAVMAGHTNQHIASNLFVSESTIKRLVRELSGLLRVEGRYGLATIGLRHGFVATPLVDPCA